MLGSIADKELIYYFASYRAGSLSLSASVLSEVVAVLIGFPMPYSIIYKH